jgi:hypothetical protein
VSTTTFQKRQKEMKRQEKQRMKAERRAQKKLASQAGEPSSEPELQVLSAPVPSDEPPLPADFEPHT